MVALVSILIVVFTVSLFSEVHALGLWFFMMITHAVLVALFGEAVEHLPMYAGLIIMAITVVRRKWTGMPVGILAVLLALIAFISMAAIFGLDPALSIGRLVGYSKGFALAIFVGGVIRDPGQIRVVTLYCLLAVLVGDYIAISEVITGEYTVDKYEVQRAGGLSGDPNDSAMLLLTGIPFALYWFVYSKNLSRKLLSAGVFVLTIGAITLTQSRGGGVALVMILSIIFLRRPSIKAFSVGIVFVSLGLLFASADYWERMQSLTTTADSDDKSLDMRYEFVETGTKIFLANPVLGVGMGNYGKALAQFNSKYDEKGSLHVAHNMYLEFFVENGFFAGMLFLALLATALLRSIRYDSYSTAEFSPYGLGFCVSMSLMAVMIAGLFLSQGSSSVLWFLVGIGLVFHKMLAEKRRFRAIR